jgi:hypothetical protein
MHYYRNMSNSNNTIAAIKSLITSTLGEGSMDKGTLCRTVAAQLGRDVQWMHVGVEVNAMLRLSRSKHGHLRCMKGHTILCTDLLDMPHNHVAILGVL